MCLENVGTIVSKYAKTPMKNKIEDLEVVRNHLVYTLIICFLYNILRWRLDILYLKQNLFSCLEQFRNDAVNNEVVGESMAFLKKQVLSQTLNLEMEDEFINY